MTMEVTKSVYESKQDEARKEVCDKWTILMAQGGLKPSKCMELVAHSMGMTTSGVRGILIKQGLYKKHRKYQYKK